jgi:orotate phosphoribosyltransferase
LQSSKREGAALESLAGNRTLILDGVATTGNMVLQAASAARAGDAEGRSVLVLIDREEGAAETLARDGIRLLYVFCARDFV